MSVKQYIAIDLKSFYASVECAARGLDPLDANLVVADLSRTEKTICLAVSPSLKSYGISGRARLFEAIQRINDVNSARRVKLGGKPFTGSSCFKSELDKHDSLMLDYITAKPRMSEYMRVSSQIYEIYLRYIAPEDIHVYSVDEVFIDATAYLKTYRMTAEELADAMVRDVLRETGITATAGIGTNMYLCKIAMDIVAKHMEADKYGVRVAKLDEQSYRELLWAHTPITDFWRVGRGYEKKLNSCGMYTMGDVARMSIYNEELLYKLFGINAELLIDHAWGWEPCTISEIKSYRPQENSLSLGQVLSTPYTHNKARLIVREMTELLTLDLVEKQLVTDQIVLSIGYDIENLTNDNLRAQYRGEVTADHYGRLTPKKAHGSENIGRFTSSIRLISEAVMRLFDRIADPRLLVRRMVVVANHTIPEKAAERKAEPEQLNLFNVGATEDIEKEKEEKELDREKDIQRAILSLRQRFGKNAVLKGMNLEEGATTVERNRQIGGHSA